mmetsp:Transcript_124611/g.363872  ORF Transcript_124611/g.363872 Transcript_124611/m.363872 type:complete len:532 (-) Transcript_124611:50-1645(-)
MGCIGSSSTYGIPPESCASAFEQVRSEHGCDVLIMAIKDQNHPGKVCIAGDADQGLVDAITKVLKADPDNATVEQAADKYDMMWKYVWRSTKLTSGHSTFSFAKSYFPRGKLMVQLLDTIASFGWGLAATPNFGGVESKDDKGNVTSTVDWPIFVYYKEKEPEFGPEHLMFAVKDSNIPGKLCAAGPVAEMESAMTQTLQKFKQDVVSEKDKYDDDYDVVWRNTSITSGAQVLSFAKKYFPKGKTNVAMLECAYSFGWRLVAAPNFGGQGDSWPCFIFRKLKDPSGAAPELLLGAIKDSNIPGKLCLAGPSASRMTDAVCGALTKVADNGDVKSEMDSYDEDFDGVCRNVKITTGMQAFSFRCKYFPRGDSMRTVVDTMAEENFQLVACPNFGGMLDSWPTFIFEKRSQVPQQMVLAVKDDNIPGKLDLVGGGVGQDPTLGPELLSALKTLCGPDVLQATDDYDQSYELAFRNTRLTTGHSTFTWSKPYWPHGYVLVALLQILYKHGFKAEGGPNFGDTGNTWPCIIFGKA